MSLSSTIYRHNSPLSPTVIHYRQKYQISDVSHNQRINSSFRKHHHSSRSHRNNTERQPSSLWEVHKSSNGRIYYYNVITDQSQWERPPKEQLSYRSSSSTNINHTQSKRGRKIDLNSYRRSNSNRSQISESIYNSNQIKSKSPHRKHHHKRRRDSREAQSSSKKLRNDQKKSIPSSTPTSPPANEIIRVDLVDPIPTPTILSDDPYKKTSKQSTNEYSLYPSESTINAILELEHSPSVKHQLNSNCDDITRYYRGELIEHLLNWPSTQIERETNRLLNEQIPIQIRELTSLRTEIYSMRLKFQRNRFQLLKYHHILSYQNHLLNSLEFIDQDQ